MPQAARRVSPADEPADLPPLEPLGALAAGLLDLARRSPAKPLVHLAASARRAEGLAEILRSFDPDLGVALFLDWDCLPYDTASPSRARMGTRMGVLRWLTDAAAAPGIVVTTPRALLRRVPPRRIWSGAHIEFRVGDRLDLAAAERELRRVGYTFDDRVDEPGEAAIRGRVIDLFPAAAPMPCRIEHEDGRIAAIRSYHPVSQRTQVEAEVLIVDPASEIVLGDDALAEDGEFPTGREHALGEFYPDLETIFDYMPDARVLAENGREDPVALVFEQIAEGYASRMEAGRTGTGGPVSPPDRLYLTPAEWEACASKRFIGTVGDASRDPERAVPRFARERNAMKAFGAFLTERMRSDRVVLAARSEQDLRRLVGRAERATGRKAEPAGDWNAVLAAPAGHLLFLLSPIDEGFILPAEKVAAVAAADLFGRRAATARVSDAAALAADADFRLGDVVVHLDHGLGILEGLDEVTLDEGVVRDVIRLRYADDAKLMVPVDEIGSIWRYGGEPDAVTLDRLKGDGWLKRRIELDREIRAVAKRLVELAGERDSKRAPKLVPPARDYDRFGARFPYELTDDQAAAIDAVLADLAAGRPMDRLICGDVGFGKTEVALRAAAAAALAGRQVCVVAPTTVLARQHFETFRRRFAPFGIEVAHLSRVVKPAEAKRVKSGLKSGEIRLVVGTHALAARGVGFADLALMIIDEEQRFGAAQKQRLKDLAADVHLLILTATPIPRTLQTGLIGLQDLSVIATPPVLRQPIRTIVAPFDTPTVRQALLREKKRAGQSFFVCPRVEDIEPMAARLREIAPEISMKVVHGKMPAEEIDRIMVDFADGDGDLLLATNIIESGLDVPRANTILIWRADRFGLAQLHQLRGRVGRGSRRGAAYLLGDPGQKMSAATEKRLRTLEALDRLGAGFAISARDLDLRGAGDLLGEEQAGHMKLIGLALYHHLLERAVRIARGETVEEEWSPELHLGVAGRIPPDYVPEEELRIGLYAGLDRLTDGAAADAFEAEMIDRFGPLPDSTAKLIALARLRALCRTLGIARLDGGPQAIAASFRPGRGQRLRQRLEGKDAPDMRWNGERLIYERPSTSADERLDLSSRFLEDLSEVGKPAA